MSGNPVRRSQAVYCRAGQRRLAAGAGHRQGSGRTVARSDRAPRTAGRAAGRPRPQRPAATSTAKSSSRSSRRSKRTPSGCRNTSTSCGNWASSRRTGPRDWSISPPCSTAGRSIFAGSWASRKSCTGTTSKPASAAANRWPHDRRRQLLKPTLGSAPIPRKPGSARAAEPRWRSSRPLQNRRGAPLARTARCRTIGSDRVPRQSWVLPKTVPIG